MALYVVEDGDLADVETLRDRYREDGKDAMYARANALDVDVHTYDVGDEPVFQEYVREQCEEYDLPVAAAAEFFELHEEHVSGTDGFVLVDLFLD